MKNRVARLLVAIAGLAVGLAALGAVTPARASASAGPPARHVETASRLPQRPAEAVLPEGVPGAPAAVPAAAPALAPAAVPATVATGPSTWVGPVLRHPSGSKFPGQVLRWANLVLAVMTEHKIPQRYLPGILAQIQQESGGDPAVVNNWDSNAARGTPSKGLLQVIAPTYRSNAKPGYTSAKYQAVPYTNIWAALNYVKKRYGMGKFAAWGAGQNQGY